MQAVDVIETIARVLRDKPHLRALFLGGGHAKGRADAYSDIDFVLVAEEGGTNAVAAPF